MISAFIEDGACPICKWSDVMLNVGREHWVVCHLHRTKWNVGYNLHCEWRDENESIWERNAAILATYQEVKPFHGEAEPTKTPGNVINFPPLKRPGYEDDIPF